MRDEKINISDVIEVIETDPTFKPQPRNMYAAPSTSTETTQTRRPKPTVQIIEQPASKALRFRYECEGRSAGSIPGVNSTAENKTHPSIRVNGYKGKAVVVVSCVTKDSPYRPHPHNLVGREGCRRGVCTLEIPTETMSITFSNLGIQCVKKKDIEAHLKTREEIRVDPFKTGFSHRNQPTSIDLNAVRLCFQVFLAKEGTGNYTESLAPVISDPIYDKKAMSDLVIVKLSDCNSTVDGGRKDIILLCEKVAKEDIQVRFFEEKDGRLVWEGFGDFQPSQVHKQTAIWFKAPKYKTIEITEPVKVFIQLRRPSDLAASEPLPFEYLPLDSGIKRKRKLEHDPINMYSPLQDDGNKEKQKFMLNNLDIGYIKTEPTENKQYGNWSPKYPPIPSISPQMFPNVCAMSSNASPELTYSNIGYLQNSSLNMMNTVNNLNQNAPLPSIINWNNPTTSRHVAEAIPADTNANINLLNLDTLHQIHISSNDLPDMAYFDNLSENLSNNLSLNEGPRTENMSMSDSLNRITQAAYENMCIPPQ